MDKTITSKYKVFDHLLEGVQIINNKWEYVYLNKTAIIHAKKSREELIGSKMDKVYPGIKGTPLFQTMREVIEKQEQRIVTNKFIYPDKSVGYFDLYLEPIEEGIIILSFDITEKYLNQERLKELNIQLQDKTSELLEKNEKLVELLGVKITLLREVHHRVKNNFQLILSLLKLQMNNISDPELRRIQETFFDRVSTMAMVHNITYSTNDIVFVDIEKLIEDLIALRTSEVINKKIIFKVHVDITDHKINIDTAIPLGLLLNEIISNAVVYGATAKNNTIEVSLDQDKQECYHLSIADHGPGIPKKNLQDDSQCIGLRLIDILTDQLDGTIKRHSDTNGTRYLIKFSTIHTNEID